MICRICGTEQQVSFRMRSGMALCDYCHKDTPSKASFEVFLKKTFQVDDPGFPRTYADKQTAREFYDDYRHSTIGDPAEYWASCSAA